MEVAEEEGAGETDDRHIAPSCPSPPSPPLFLNPREEVTEGERSAAKFEEE